MAAISRKKHGLGRPRNPHESFGPDDFLVTEQVAEYTGLSTSFYEKRRVKNLPPIWHKLGGRVRYLRAHIDEWIESNRHGFDGGNDD